MWILLSLGIGIAGGFLIAHGLHIRRGATPRMTPPTESTAVRDAKDVLRRRYANGEMSREDYLQGNVELED
jgi:uncharacterized membrane protein